MSDRHRERGPATDDPLALEREDERRLDEADARLLHEAADIEPLYREIGPEPAWELDAFRGGYVDQADLVAEACDSLSDDAAGDDQTD